MRTTSTSSTLDGFGFELPFVANPGEDEQLDTPPWAGESGEYAVSETESGWGSPYARESVYAGELAQAGVGRLVVYKVAMLASHRGGGPDLVLRWTGIAGPCEVTVVVHFHGYSRHGAAMRIDRDKEPNSGLDFANPADPAEAGRMSPTVAVLPRGNFFGGKSGAGYNFPALTARGALQRLIDDALARVSRETGADLRQGRLIITGHSGGGSPINAVLAHMDPDEVQIFDGTYGSADNVVRWATKRIVSAMAPTILPSLRILYRPGGGTQAVALGAGKTLCRALGRAPDELRRRFRVEATKIAHNDIPRRFGWRLLADAGTDLPEVSSRVCPGPSQNEAEASPYWQSPATAREASLLATDFVGYAPNASDLDYVGEESNLEFGEQLAWLDYEGRDEGEDHTGPTTDSEWGELEHFSEEGFDATGEYSDASAAETIGEGSLETLEALLESEAGMGSGLADELKGIAAFVLGPELRRGARGSAVAFLQRVLGRLGADLAVDGDFGPNTERAVKAFQSRSALAVTGVVVADTKTALASALTRSAVGPHPPAPTPTPRPLPSPVPGGTDLGHTIARIAEEEFQRWNQPGNALKETEAAATPILQRYYREGVKQDIPAANLQDPAWQNDHPWSAVFVSFVMRNAGAGSTFRYSTLHQTYVVTARKNRLTGNAASPFWAYRPDEIVPEIGDLICMSRKNSGATYDNIADGRSYLTHCDIVTAVRPGEIRTVGGNVHQNVAAKRVRTLPDGRLAVDGDQKLFYAIVRCRGAAGSAPTPVPPVPTPSPASPSGTSNSSKPTKLAPRDFVARYAAAAQASEAVSKVPALVTLGQAALESGWGGHAPRFNFFGIKAKASDPPESRQLLRTREVFSDQTHKFPEIISISPRSDGRYDYVVKDWFRAYPDADTAFLAHGQFLVRNKRYAKAFATSDPYDFASAVAAAGYATDPSYARQLHSVMHKIEALRGQ